MVYCFTPTGARKGQYRRVGTWLKPDVVDNNWLRHYQDSVDPCMFEDVSDGLAVISII
jgi:hypothetical protein